MLLLKVLFFAAAGVQSAHSTDERFVKSVSVQKKSLNQYGFIQTHDSATGELVQGRDYIVDRVSRTQKGSILDQLDCGARSLDYRPYLSENGTIFAHHGPLVVYKQMEQTLQELIAWGKTNPSELIIFEISHCVDARVKNNYYADICHDSVIDLLTKYNINTVTSEDCSPLTTMTMESALAKGTILANVGCTTGYWDPTVTCSGKGYVCYDSWPENTTSLPWTRLENSLVEWSSFVPVDDGRFWGFGANWQSSVESDVFMTLHNSSLIIDEERSGLNAWTAQSIRSGKFKYLNFVGVDNVCDAGPEIFAALQEYNAKI